MKIKLSFVALTIILLVVACAPATPVEPTPDVNVIRTSAAETVVAELTLTAAAFTPTSQPLPTETATIAPPPTETPTIALATDLTQIAQGTPGALCDDYSFELATLDVTIPDGTPMTPGQEFVKTWKIKNTGICTWDTNYKAIFSYSSPPNERMNGQPVPLAGLVAPGQEVDVSVQFKAPTTPGEYTGYWQMVNAKGIPFGQKDFILIVKIVVQ
ncbi:MAG TPA: NBR1-Ig-like domain-containing protein [Anaerolineales bacterium]|nr:NBR1-Ig-like domain-containing protein [Anaerolineales bacterium]